MRAEAAALPERHHGSQTPQVPAFMGSGTFSVLEGHELGGAPGPTRKEVREALEAMQAGRQEAALAALRRYAAPSDGETAAKVLQAKEARVRSTRAQLEALEQERDTAADECASAKAYLEEASKESLEGSTGEGGESRPTGPAAAERFLGFEIPSDLLEELDEVDDAEAKAELEKSRAELERYQEEGRSTLEDTDQKRKEVERVFAELYEQAEQKAEKLKGGVDQARARARSATKKRRVGEEACKEEATAAAAAAAGVGKQGPKAEAVASATTIKEEPTTELDEETKPRRRAAALAEAKSDAGQKRMGQDAAGASKGGKYGKKDKCGKEGSPARCQEELRAVRFDPVLELQQHVSGHFEGALLGPGGQPQLVRVGFPIGASPSGLPQESGGYTLWDDSEEDDQWQLASALGFSVPRRRMDRGFQDARDDPWFKDGDFGKGS
ncbi:unnamed protein product, partial [Prorocentrum cordatum]